MAQVQLRLAIRKRWFFRPAFAALILLAKLGIIRDFGGAAGWLVEHGIRWKAV